MCFTYVYIYIYIYTNRSTCADGCVGKVVSPRRRVAAQSSVASEAALSPLDLVQLKIKAEKKRETHRRPQHVEPRHGRDRDVRSRCRPEHVLCA